MKLKLYGEKSGIFTKVGNLYVVMLEALILPQKCITVKNSNLIKKKNDVYFHESIDIL